MTRGRATVRTSTPASIRREAKVRRQPRDQFSAASQPICDDKKSCVHLPIGADWFAGAAEWFYRLLACLAPASKRGRHKDGCISESSCARRFWSGGALYDAYFGQTHEHRSQADHHHRF